MLFRRIRFHCMEKLSRPAYNTVHLLLFKNERHSSLIHILAIKLLDEIYAFTEFLMIFFSHSRQLNSLVTARVVTDFCY